MQREMIIFEWKLVCVEIVANAQIDQRAEVNHLNIHMYIYVHILVRFMKIIITMLPLLYLIIALAQLTEQFCI